MKKSSFVGVLLLGAVAVVGAQQAGFTRSVLQQVDLSIPGREAITARAEFQPGGSVGRHTHFGEEIGYVASGAVTNRLKRVKPGRIVTSFVSGTQKLFDFVDDNALVEFHPSDRTNCLLYTSPSPRD